MKLQSASRKEIKRISIGTGLLDLLLVAVLFLLSLLGVGTFDLFRILLSLLIGSAIAIANFTVLCLTAQSAVGMTDMKQMKAKFQLSYNIRMVIQAGWTVTAFLLPQFHFVAAAAPILFPSMVLILLRKRIQTESSGVSSPSATEIPDEDDGYLGPFEV